MNYSIQELRQMIENLPAPKELGEITPLSCEGLPRPSFYPRAGHPRVLINPEKLEVIRQNLNAEENGPALADYLLRSDDETDGVMPALGEGETSNFSWDPLTAIEAKALRYLLEGDERYGLEAILILMNFLRTAVILPGGRGDRYHCYGYTLFVSALVYDWCYPLTSAREREAIVAAVETRVATGMEMGFPPTYQGAFTGHGSESQFLRDWYALALAVADEYPDIYKFVAGRLEKYYVPVRDYYFLSGKQSQGNCYGNSRNTLDLYAQYLAQTASGEKLFHGDMLAVARSFLYNLRPDDTSFRTGDDQGQRFPEYTQLGYDLNLFYASILYRDEVAKEEAFRLPNNVLNFRSAPSHSEWSGVQFLAWNDPTIGRAGHAGLPCTAWFGSPVGQYIVRERWDDPNAACLFMKLGEKYAANHEHRDMGQFQIFYRGILASESGFYDRYGSKVDMWYSKQTIAHNCILIHDPSENTGNFPNTGGHNFSSRESYDLDNWLSRDQTHRAALLGHEHAEDENGAPRYAYLAGDLATAYGNGKAKEALRYMHGVFTGDAAHPLLFFVYDRITATSPDFKKTFLLHFETEPKIDGGLTVIKNDGGALVSRTLLPKEERRESELIRGCYVVNGESLTAERNFRPCKTMERGWGRLEVSPKKGEATDEFFHAMYVTDEGKTEAIAPASLFESEALVGASLLGVAVFFSRSRERVGCAFRTVEKEEGTLEKEIVPLTVKGEGDGEMLYQVGGLETGAWLVRDSEGRSVAARHVTAESGLLTFRAPAGTYTLIH